MVKKFFKNIKAKCKGFSLMELVVTIAIMAVLAAVLTPALIHYVEDSRATKDNHAMTEVVNAMKVALAYDDVYDEVIDDITWKNSCYVDSDNPKAENIEYLFVDDNEKAYKSYIYKDAERELDETPYKFAGRMYGATVTFRPNNENVIEIKDGVYSGIDVQGKKISEMSEENMLYTKIKQVIGNKIELTSATYKNSQYTIFICFGVEAKKTQSESKVTLSDEPIVIYGQWSGTNLLTIEMQDPSLDDTPDFDYGKHDGIIPEGGSFESVITFKDSCCPMCGFNFEDPTCWCGNCHYSDGYDKCDNCDYVFAQDPNNIWCWCGTFSQQEYLDSKDSVSGSLGEGEAFPIVDSSDIYVYGDYTYIYNGSYYNEPYCASLDRQFTANNSIGGWLVAVRDEAEASSNTYHSYFKQQDSYSMPLTSIGGKPVVSMNYCFYGHNGNIIKEVNLPSTLTILDGIFWNAGSNNGPLRIEKLNFGGTKAQWAQLIQKYTYWTDGLDTSFTTVVHCVDGDVCVNHSFVADNSATVEKHTTSQHKKKATCSKCGIDGYIYQSHSWDSNVQYSEYSSSSHYETKTCTICGQVYKYASSHTYGTKTYAANNNSQHYIVKTCTKCSYENKTAESHSANSSSLWTYTNSTTSQHIINKKCTKCNLTFTSTGTHSAGSENSSWVYESTGHATQHTITSPCTKCSGSYVRNASHSGSDSCLDPQPCTKCKQTYRGYHNDVDYRVRSISDTEHVEEGYCDTCEQWHENYRSIHSADGYHELGDYQTCTTADSWTCYCGYQHIGTGNKTHLYRTAGCGTVSCVCGETTIQGTNHHIVGNMCSVCGLLLDQLSVSITQENVYTNNVDGMIVGSWNFEGASSVTITINGSCESYDFVFFAEGNNHSPGLSTARKYLSTSGRVSTSLSTIPSGNASSEYKFRDTQTNTRLTVDMPVGTIFWDTDGSVVNYPGFTITVTPNYS